MRQQMVRRATRPKKTLHQGHCGELLINVIRFYHSAR